MDPNTRLTLILAGAAAAISLAACAAIAIQYWRRKSPEELERLRRLDVNRRGRIATAYVLDVLDGEALPSPRLVLYKYEVAGVTYESAQDISALPDVVSVARSLVGHLVSVKYDPRRPTNSIFACEDWCGATADSGTRDSATGNAQKVTPELSPNP